MTREVRVPAYRPPPPAKLPASPTREAEQLVGTLVGIAEPLVGTAPPEAAPVEKPDKSEKSTTRSVQRVLVKPDPASDRDLANLIADHSWLSAVAGASDPAASAEASKEDTAASLPTNADENGGGVGDIGGKRPGFVTLGGGWRLRRPPPSTFVEERSKQLRVLKQTESTSAASHEDPTANRSPQQKNPQARWVAIDAEGRPQSRGIVSTTSSCRPCSQESRADALASLKAAADKHSSPKSTVPDGSDAFVSISGQRHAQAQRYLITRLDGSKETVADKRQRHGARAEGGTETNRTGAQQADSTETQAEPASAAEEARSISVQCSWDGEEHVARDSVSTVPPTSRRFVVQTCVRGQELFKDGSWAKLVAPAPTAQDKFETQLSSMFPCLPQAVQVCGERSPNLLLASAGRRLLRESRQVRCWRPPDVGSKGSSMGF
eukprot:gnl/TRDRNA2_/TRDRNA2_184920_c0_seq1.p1 gnl/TRDRNA2_/TRDRNA2_184920_c0~~gnl/TRDRNA2_/TRDRNA2_184920_c0_seq1.p1  ORF type:complete len:436 (+),score=51.45 gnl/TRDRNA2_/TRDRNA2_184920_c0_seq1:114-1421(+)